MTAAPVSESAIRRCALRIATGNAKRKDADASTLDAAFAAIKGQEKAVRQIKDAALRDIRGLFPKTKPTTMLFAGASGVGKTAMAKALASALTDESPIIVNMCEYNSPASINRLIGSPAGYVGSDSNQELPFDVLESNPYKVILLDEFEKSDPSVQRLFMSAFDEGAVTTARGKVIDFSKATIIATTNADHTRGRTHAMGFSSGTSTDAEKKARLVESLSAWFDVELLNRFQLVIEFDDISKDVYKDIVADIWSREVARIKSERRSVSLPDELPEEELESLAQKTFVPAFGARPAERAVRELIEELA